MKDLFPPAYRLLFRQRDFRLFWTGFTLSVIGDAMSHVALTWYVWETTHSPQALGLLTFFYTGPVVVGGLFAGILLDRFGPRRVMIIDSLLRGAAFGLIPLLHFTGALRIWHIYTIAGVYGGLMMISLAGSPTMIPSLISEDLLPAANALETIAFTLGGVVGPPIAGALIGLIGVPNVILADVMSYFAFAALLWRVQGGARETARSDGGREPVRLSTAIKLLIGNRILLSTTAMYLSANVGLGMMSVWLPVKVDEMGGKAGIYGAFLGAIAGGEVTSSVLAGTLRAGIPLGLLIGLAQIASGLSVAGVLLGNRAWIVALSLVLLGFFSAPLTIWAQTLRMRIVPPELRGRTFALLRTLMQGGNPVGGLLGGAFLPAAGVSGAIAVSAALVGLPGAVGLRVRELREAGGESHT